MDNLNPQHRKKNMQNIRSANTNIELIVRSELHRKGYRFRKNVKNVFGKPDIVFPKHKIVIFLDSCFWHMCPYHFNIPKTNKKYWVPKLKRNKLRDIEVSKKLRNEGWIVLRFWEHQIENNLEKCVNKIISHLL